MTLVRKKCKEDKDLSAGFTLIELVVTVAIAALLMGIAAPSFRDSVLNSQHIAEYNDLMGSLRFARSEAIKRSSRTAVCARANDTACGSNWSNGFLVFIDNGDNPGEVDADEEILRIKQPSSSDVKISNSAKLLSSAGSPIARPFIRFGPRGTSNWRGTGYFTLCDLRGSDEARAVNIAFNGDARKARRNETGELLNSFGSTVSCTSESG